ncbi:N-acetylmuramoyl-L-alanine amidase family protein [Brevibacillus laterosporus]|uniref:N-acetylmuramoyl-L-alanine amidase n=1 Tax=Brevibacillus laterosporus TaxID=1465 RepID=A0AAP3DGI5_BRELA|nr:N-acetylmuramoyl-L-alanine amidase [Brevibacillus laterosporus]MCR8980511.1 N-acetylmuramoyl-L-alanine amidase [Brevibacillus laterosporus]MCZ0807666.1 N-acetylmuramoyl-L-alanine amidase [Brevibacillus laterosporus]MCZ0827041.1 N-acetylmuramoyl-L-alanine amidase [Brevibacillus laterosporus]MCZ0851094.1 N-acetylmuramoyl-L-alanine amidase [Brevibacillus laterosporus]
MKNEPDADPVIAIDPGHGGKDPGSIGSDGTDEADLNLKIAKKTYSIFFHVLTKEESHRRNVQWLA